MASDGGGGRSSLAFLLALDLHTSVIHTSTTERDNRAHERKNGEPTTHRESNGGYHQRCVNKHKPKVVDLFALPCLSTFIPRWHMQGLT